MSAVHELNRALAAALGLPKLTTRAVLTLEGFSAIGIELDPEYIAIAKRRIASDMPLFA